MNRTDRPLRRIFFSVGIGAALLAQNAFANEREPTDEEQQSIETPERIQMVLARTPEEQARQAGLQLQLQIDQQLGAGTLVDSTMYAYAAGVLAVRPLYLFEFAQVRWVASAVIRASYEYTRPDVETGRQLRAADVRLAITAPAIFREARYSGIALTPALSMSVPTSTESWSAGLVTNIGASVTLSRSIADVDLRASVSGARGIFGSPQNAIAASAARDERARPMALCRAGESACAFSNWNTAWSMSVGGFVQWRVTSQLFAYGQYEYFQSWNHTAIVAEDAYTPKALTSDGRPVATTGAGRTDRSIAVVGLSYQLDEHYSVDFAVSTVQPPLTPQGQVRFPFLSFGTWADNTTLFSLSIAAAY